MLTIYIYCDVDARIDNTALSQNLKKYVLDDSLVTMCMLTVLISINLLTNERNVITWKHQNAATTSCKYFNVPLANQTYITTFVWKRQCVVEIYSSEC